MSFSPNGQLLAAGDWPSAGPNIGGGVRIWDTTRWREVRALPGARFPAIFSPDGKWLVSGGWDETASAAQFQLWDTANWQVVARCPAATPLLDWQHRHSVVFSPDGKLLATPWLDMSQGKCGLRLWKVPALDAQADLFPAGMPLSAAAFLPDGKHFVAGTWDARLVVWDLDRLDAPVQILREHTANITAIATAPGTDHFATASADGTVNLWDVASRQLSARLRGHLKSL